MKPVHASSLIAFLIAALGLSACHSPNDTTSSSASVVANRPPELKPNAENVGIVVFDGLFITELTAPFDVYKHTGDEMNVFTVGRSMAPYQTYCGLALVPDYSFENCPRIDVLVVPSGIHSVDEDLEDDAFIAFIRERAKQATWVTSHCWGAFSLAQAGVLEGRSCMTFPTSIDQLQAAYPKVRTRKDSRFVVDGNLVTSGGGLAAYEAAVWIVEQMYGAELAQKVADGMVFADQNRAYSAEPLLAGAK